MKSAEIRRRELLGEINKTAQMLDVLYSKQETDTNKVVNERELLLTLCLSIIDVLEFKLDSWSVAYFVFAREITKSTDDSIILSWCAHNELSGECFETMDGRKISDLLMPLSNGQRVRVLLTLLFLPMTAKELMDKHALTSGQIYHHLRELGKAGYVVANERGLYSINKRARRFLLTVISYVASQDTFQKYDSEISKEIYTDLSNID